MKWAFDWRRYMTPRPFVQNIYHLPYSNCACYKCSTGRRTWDWYFAVPSRTTKQVLASYPTLPFSFALPHFLTPQVSKYSNWSVVLHSVPEGSKPVVSRPAVNYRPRSWSCTSAPSTRTQEIPTLPMKAAGSYVSESSVTIPAVPPLPTCTAL
jgi:hypothetical protein